MIVAQDGYGPSTKIDEGIDAGVIGGTILSIKTRKPDTLPQIVASLMGKPSKPEVFLDTHFYASDIAMTSPGHIQSYGLYDYGLTKKQYTITNIQNYARRIIDYQRGLGLKNIIIPGLTVSNFDDFTSLLSFQFYDASLAYLSEITDHEVRKTYITISLRESCLRDREKLSQFLDDITTYDVDGFYIVVEREKGDAPQWHDALTLAKLMYIVKTLSENYEVICGFTDFTGLPLIASGAKYVASGWSQTLRQYTASYFVRGTGGSNDKFRYASKELLAQIISIPDLQSIIRFGFSSKYVDPLLLANFSDPDNLVRDINSLILHQWRVYSELEERIITSPDRLSEMDALLSEAKENLEELRGARVIIDPSSVGHYDVWRQAIAELRAGVL